MLKYLENLTANPSITPTEEAMLIDVTALVNI